MSEFFRRNCKECGSREPHSMILDSGAWMWRCENCGTRTPKRERRARAKATGMTPAQRRAVEKIRQELVRRHHGDVEKYELKRFEVEERESFVGVIAETGLRGDEGTMASVFCRRTVVVAIGRRGGVELINAKDYSNRRGWFEVFHGLTSY